MDKIFIIFNPAARGEKSRRARRFLEAQAGPSTTLAPTQRANEAQSLAARAVSEGYKVIVAAGGDGTINEVVNGIGTSGVALGVLPLGTLNVFAHELGIPRKLEAAWAVIHGGHTRKIDLACTQANGATRYFVQLAGVGFDAHAVRTASLDLKKHIGPLSYVWAGFKALSKRHPPIEVSVNGSGPLGSGVAVLVGNGRFYGGPLTFFPKARLDDGLLDICVFKTVGFWDVLRYGQGILRGVHIDFCDVKYFQAENLACRVTGPTPFELDGEDAGDAPVTFSVVPRALRVVVPKANRGDNHA